MSCRNTTAPTIGLLAIAWLLSSCAVGLSEQSRIDHAYGLLNRRAFSEAVATLEQDLVEHPANPTFSVLLAHAHLGASGFELIRFLSDLSEDQEGIPELGIARMPDCAAEKLATIRRTRLHCVLIRLIKRMPEADDPHVARARVLLREAYPDAALAPEDVNFLSAFVEIGSAISRLRPNAVENHALPLETIQSELRHGIVRARHSYRRIGRYIADLESVDLEEDLGVARLTALLRPPS